VAAAAVQIIGSAPGCEQSGVQPKNGHLPRSTEAGGDMGGAVLTVQADLDNITDTGKEPVNLKQ